MSGSVPLQLFEFVFEARGCYVLDCGAFTPLFGLAAGGHTRRAEALDGAYDEHGLEGLLAVADTVTWLSWEDVDRVVVSDGGWLTRPTLAVETRTDAPSRRVRLHDVDGSAVADALATFLEDVGDPVRLDHDDGFL